MNGDKIVKIAAIGFVGLVVVPTVIGIGANLLTGGVIAIEKLVNKAKWNKMIKKGLKEGSIVKGDDGKYYRVEGTDFDYTI